MKKILLLLLLFFSITTTRAVAPMGSVYQENCFKYDASTGKILLKAIHNPPSMFYYYWDNPFTTWAYVKSGGITYGPFIVSAIIPTPPGTMDPPITWYEVTLPGFSFQECYEVWYVSNRTWYYDDPTNSWAYTPPANLDPYVINSWMSPVGSREIKQTDVYTACICPDSDTLPTCNSNFKFNLMAYTSPPPMLLVGMMGTVTLSEFHPGSTYLIDWGSGDVPYTGLTSMWDYLSPSGSKRVCITEILPSGERCKTCMDFCIPVSESVLPESLMKKTDVSNEKTSDLLLGDRLPKVIPNPTKDAFEIIFTLTKNQKVSVDIIDITGKVVNGLAYKDYPKGENRIHINSRDLPPGVYQVRISRDSKVDNVKLSVIK